PDTDQLHHSFLHDALPIFRVDVVYLLARRGEGEAFEVGRDGEAAAFGDARECVVALLVRFRHGGESARERDGDAGQIMALRVNKDRKSTRLNSRHLGTSYA